MDPVTHAALGGSLGLAVGRRRLGRRAVAVGALVAMSPDADIVAGWLGGPFANLLYHRGITHSILIAPIVGAAVGYGLWWLHQRWGRSAAAASRDRRTAWIALAIAALLTHPLLDVITHYGTQLLAPLSDHRFGIPALPVIDPVMTLLLGLPALVGAFATRRASASVAIAWAGMILAYAYAMYGWSLNDAAEAEARRQLAEAGTTGVEIQAYPTILQPYYRRIVARKGDAIWVGFHSSLNPRPIAWVQTRSEGGPAIAAVTATREAEILAWFADGQLLWRRDGATVEARDLRYGYPGGGELGMWGIRALIGADGAVVDGPSMFTVRPPSTGESLTRLWQLVFG